MLVLSLLVVAPSLADGQHARTSRASGLRRSRRLRTLHGGWKTSAAFSVVLWPSTNASATCSRIWAKNACPFELFLVEAWQFAAKQLAAILTTEGLALRDRIGFDDAQVIQCEPLGFARQVTAPLPIRIEQRDDRVNLSYEEWGAVRTVYMDGRSHPSSLPPSRYGHSIGRYEGGALVIQTASISASSLWPELGGGGYTDRLRTVERYARDGQWLKLDHAHGSHRVARTLGLRKILALYARRGVFPA